MSKTVIEIANGVQDLNHDIIEGVENNLIKKIPGWKVAMVRFYFTTNNQKFNIYCKNLRTNCPNHKNTAPWMKQDKSTK